MLNMRAFKAAEPSFVLYPILCKQTTHYHTGMFVRMMTSMIKRILPKHMTEGFEFEADCEFGRLDEVFSLPDPETARQRLLDRLVESLERRYEQEKQFRLE